MAYLPRGTPWFATLSVSRLVTTGSTVAATAGWRAGTAACGCACAGRHASSGSPWRAAPDRRRRGRAAELRDELLGLLRDLAEVSWHETRRALDDLDARTGWQASRCRPVRAAGRVSSHDAGASRLPVGRRGQRPPARHRMRRSSTSSDSSARTGRSRCSATGSSGGCRASTTSCASHSSGRSPVRRSTSGRSRCTRAISDRRPGGARRDRRAGVRGRDHAQHVVGHRRHPRRVRERRGKATMHRRFGRLPAMMASGYIVADAYAAIAEDRPPTSTSRSWCGGWGGGVPAVAVAPATPRRRGLAPHRR